LAAGQAVASSITHEPWQRHLPGIPPVTAAAAGAVLGRICGEAELTLFAHYDTDLVGHRRDPDAAAAVLVRVDEFLAGLLGALPADALLVIASDHGNVEDASAGHTTNPVPVIAAGPGASELVQGVRAITDVAPALLRLLDIT
jgi:2,3-bisphosphoglycerate-independent phosphoglycerate mutase